MNTRTIITKEPLRLRDGRASIKNIKPRRKEHKLFIEQLIDEFGTGWEMNIQYDEYYMNIIADGNRDFKPINNGDYATLYDDIKNYADECMSEIEDVETGAAAKYVSFYRPAHRIQTDALKAYFGSSAAVEITPYITGQFKKIMRTAKNEDEQTAMLMTLFTPYTWEWSAISGYCQGDWQDVLYPVELYDNEDIKEYGDYYMGCYMEYLATYKGETCSYYFTDLWDVDDIIKNIASDYDLNAEVVYKSYFKS